jgi:C-terminal processing protease CtpA/Prc
VPRIMTARNGKDYQLALLEFSSRIHDAHVQPLQGQGARPPEGGCQVPATIRNIEDKPVVTAYSDVETQRTGLKIGDVILSVDGVSAAALLHEWRPYYSASNEETLKGKLTRALARGVCGRAQIVVRRDGVTESVAEQRVPVGKLDLTSAFQDDRPGDAFQLLSPQIAYLKLSAASQSKAAEYIKQASGTKGLIIDIRGYPAEFMVWALGPLLLDKPARVNRRTVANINEPGAFFWAEPDTMRPREPHYAGNIAILVDENSVSQSEATALVFRASPRAIVVGSTTAGADGDVSPFSLPGQYSTQISGCGSFDLDKRPTQHIGIVPDVVVRPSIAGIMSGHDEILEAAVRAMLHR